MPAPQKRKRKHLANRKFPRKQTPWNSHQPTPDDAVHCPDRTTNITSLHRTLKKKLWKHNHFLCFQLSPCLIDFDWWSIVSGVVVKMCYFFNTVLNTTTRRDMFCILLDRANKRYVNQIVTARIKYHYI